MSDGVHEQAVTSWHATDKGCRPSGYLRDIHSNHDEVPECDEELEEHFKECGKTLGEQVQKQWMDRQLRRKAAGIEDFEACTIL